MPDSTRTEITAADQRHDYSHRLMGWAALCFFSVIALAAQVADTWGEARRKDDNFVIAVAASSTILSFFCIMGYAIGREKFAGGALEGLFAVVSVLFWICGMPVIMDAKREIAVSKATPTQTYIRNANIYFFSWASTIAIVYVLGRFVRQFILERQNDPDPAH